MFACHRGIYPLTSDDVHFDVTAALPLSIAHLLMEDDVYEGYFIPKGTVVLPNVWYVRLVSSVHQPINRRSA